MQSACQLSILLQLIDKYVVVDHMKLAEKIQKRPISDGLRSKSDGMRPISDALPQLRMNANMRENQSDRNQLRELS